MKRKKITGGFGLILKVRVVNKSRTLIVNNIWFADNAIMAYEDVKGITDGTFVYLPVEEIISTGKNLFDFLMSGDIISHYFLARNKIPDESLSVDCLLINDISGYQNAIGIIQSLNNKKFRYVLRK